MVFCSFIFILLFLPITLFFYYIYNNRNYRNIILVIFSLIFYAWGEPKYILLLLLSIVVNYFLTLKMDKSNTRKLILIISIIYNVGILFIFKYLNFSIFTINNIFDFNINKLNIGLPIGISFYTFQILSYVIDVYRREVKAEKNIVHLFLYISLFPQLIAGPIVKYKEIYKQIKHRKETVNKFYIGIRRFMIGFAKKVVLANNLAVVCDTIYGYDTSMFSMPILWLAALAFTLQIYFDFSGYSDMAIGLGSVFGFKIPENFNYPYISTSITEYWRRWHISLTTWFRDYIYIPLGGNRCGKVKLIRNTIIILLLTGLWHGANYNYIIWGLYNGIFIVLEKTILKQFLNKVPKVIKWFITMNIIVIGWVIFRIQNINTLIVILGEMFNFNNLTFLSIYYSSYELVLASLYIPIAILCCFPVIKLIKRKFKYKNVLEIFSFCFVVSIYLYSIFLLIQKTTKTFIYFKF